jgi:hypothetical protein
VPPWIQETYKYIIISDSSNKSPGSLHHCALTALKWCSKKAVARAAVQ